MRRFAFSFVAAVSLLLCLGTAALWVWNGEYYGTYLVKSWGSNAYHEFTITVIGRSIAAGYIKTDFIPHGSQTTAGLSDAMTRYAGFRRGYRPLFQPDFSFRHERRIQSSKSGWLEYNNNFGGEVASDEAYRFSLPIWTYSAVTAVLPLIFAAVWLMRRRRLPHQCPTCTTI